VYLCMHGQIGSTWDILAWVAIQPDLSKCDTFQFEFDPPEYIEFPPIYICGCKVATGNLNSWSIIRYSPTYSNYGRANTGCSGESVGGLPAAWSPGPPPPAPSASCSSWGSWWRSATSSTPPATPPPPPPALCLWPTCHSLLTLM
jgi:hypothetical protein